MIKSLIIIIPKNGKKDIPSPKQQQTSINSPPTHNRRMGGCNPLPNNNIFDPFANKYNLQKGREKVVWEAEYYLYYIHSRATPAFQFYPPTLFHSLSMTI